MTINLKTEIMSVSLLQKSFSTTFIFMPNRLNFCKKNFIQASTLFHLLCQMSWRIKICSCNYYNFNRNMIYCSF